MHLLAAAAADGVRVAVAVGVGGQEGASFAAGGSNAAGGAVNRGLGCIAA